MMLRRAMILITAGLVFTACSSRQEPEQPAPEQPPAPVQARPTVNQDSIDAARRAAEEAARREEAAREARSTLEEMIFFDYDDSSIRSDQQEVLNRKVAILRANPAVTLRVTGHADERGSLEYNLALGRARASSVRDYIAGFGLQATRFTIDSMGEDRPLDAGHTESAWSQNRRAEFVITAGGDNLTRPTGDW
ncbi:MAG: OmpA family protein [Longimicrobiales bacterium]